MCVLFANQGGPRANLERLGRVLMFATKSGTKGNIWCFFPRELAETVYKWKPYSKRSKNVLWLVLKKVETEDFYQATTKGSPPPHNLIEGCDLDKNLSWLEFGRNTPFTVWSKCSFPSTTVTDATLPKHVSSIFSCNINHNFTHVWLWNKSILKYTT